MSMILILIATLLVALVLGKIVFGITHAYPKIKSLRVGISIVFGLFSLVASFLVFHQYQSPKLFTDSRVFQNRTQLQLILNERSVQSDTNLKGSLVIEVVVPESVQVSEDFSFRLTLSIPESKKALPQVYAFLNSTKTAHVRTLDSCGSKSLSNQPVGSVAACSSEGFESNLRNLIWDITPSKTGSISLELKLPKILEDGVFVDVSKPWHVKIMANKRQILEKSNEEGVGIFLGGSSYAAYFVPLYLTNDRPTARLSEFMSVTTSMNPVQPPDIKVNLASMQLRFPIEAETTLGVTESTYSLMTIICTILASILGSGWIWKLGSHATPSTDKKTRKLEDESD